VSWSCRPPTGYRAGCRRPGAKIQRGGERAWSIDGEFRNKGPTGGITGQAVKDAMTGDFLHHGRAIGVEFVELVRDVQSRMVDAAIVAQFGRSET